MLRLLPILALAACTDANHLGNPLTLPIRAVTTGIENAAYDRDRAQVKTYITENEATMRANRFQGPTTAVLLSTLPAQNREKVRAELIEAAPLSDFPERATVIVMVHR